MSPPSDQSFNLSKCSTFNRAEQRTLLQIARYAIVETIVHQRIWRPEPEGSKLLEPRGAFVTLEQRGRLRGCVGQPTAQYSVARTVAHCAVAAAREDTRFRPIQPTDLAELSIEISVLSPMEPVDPGQIEIGRHGLFVVRNDLKGLLLPSVASERGWTPERFLSETSRKAGLPSNSWQLPGTQLYSFTADVFSEDEFIQDTDSPSVAPLSQTRFK